MDTYCNMWMRILATTLKRLLLCNLETGGLPNGGFKRVRNQSGDDFWKKAPQRNNVSCSVKLKVYRKTGKL